MLTLFRNLFPPPRHMILLILAAWAGLTLAEKRAERHGITKDDLNNLVFHSLLGFLIGGRLFFVLQNASIFLKSPSGIFTINPDVFDPLGAWISAILIALIYGQKHKLPLWHTLDVLTPFFSILMIGIGLSQLAAGTAFGRETTLPWSIELWNAERHPVQLYHAIASFLIFSLIWFNLKDRPPGLLFLNFAALTAASHVFLEAFRADSPLIFSRYNQDQVVAWSTLCIIFLIIEGRLRQIKKGLS